MIKYLLFASGLLLNTPLALAQGATPAAPATPATPAVPKETPATPAIPATPADPTQNDGTRDPAVNASGQAKASADFAAFDVNGDGSLSKQELSTDINLSFKDMDHNANGKITRGEFEAAMKAKKSKR